MLARYKIYRGKRPPDEFLPDSIRQDTRKHTSHYLRPTAEIVESYLAEPTTEAWKTFKLDYLHVLEDRHHADSQPYEKLAELAMNSDVFLGCSCPTAKNPNVQHCHTVLSLQFMRKHYPAISIELP